MLWPGHLEEALFSRLSGDGVNEALSPDYIAVGKVIKPHGLGGSLKVKPFLEAEFFAERVRSCFLYRSEDRYLREVIVEELSDSGKGLIVKFGGFDLSTAEAMRGCYLIIHKSELPKIEDTEYYFYELLDAEVFTENGSSIGKVVDIIETGANDVLVIQKGRPGFDLQEELIPVTREHILKIDRSAACIVVKMLEYEEDGTDENIRSHDIP